MGEIIYGIEHITKKFPGVTALDDVSLSIKQGEVLSLIGENGAGKSTLIKIMSGVTQPTSGELFFNGKKVRLTRPMEAQELGISVVHQELKLVDALSVAENIFLGRPRTGALGLVDGRAQISEAQKLLDSLNARLDPRENVGRLSVAQKQLVEICKALSYNAKLIIMDEPSATLTDKELDVLFDIIKMLRDKGVTIIYISHRLEEVFKLADRVSILRDGRVIDTLPIGAVDRKKLIELMVGRKLENEYPKRRATLGGELLRVENLSRQGAFKDISFTLREGEILGIAGLVGSGRTELVRTIFGADKKTAGKIYIRGKEARVDSIPKAIKQKLALVPEERKTQGLSLEMMVKENISMAGMKQILTHHMISAKKESALARRHIKSLRIVTPDENRETKNLSGGNQQKVVLAKWLTVDSDILMFDEPTRGIDVGAKADIYALLAELACRGKGIIMVSSEMPELIGMCERIIVMHDGRITGEVTSGEATQELIMEYATR